MNTFLQVLVETLQHAKFSFKDLTKTFVDWTWCDSYNLHTFDCRSQIFRIFVTVSLYWIEIPYLSVAKSGGNRRLV